MNWVLRIVRVESHNDGPLYEVDDSRQEVTVIGRDEAELAAAALEAGREIGPIRKVPVIGPVD